MSLKDYLQQAGYRRVPLFHNGIGHFRADGELNGRPIRVLIDTGASATIIRRDLADEMGLEKVKLSQMGGGAGGVTLEVFLLSNACLTLGEVTPNVNQLLSLDLTHVNQGLAQEGAEQIDAVLGVDVFISQAAVIDYASSSLYLKCH